MRVPRLRLEASALKVLKHDLERLCSTGVHVAFCYPHDLYVVMSFIVHRYLPVCV